LSSFSIRKGSGSPAPPVFPNSHGSVPLDMLFSTFLYPPQLLFAELKACGFFATG